MTVYLAADHRGFSLKEKLRERLKLAGFSVMDMGAEIYDKSDDYVDFVQAVCQMMKADDRAILLCGSGHGVNLVANRFSHVRCVLGFNLDVTVQGREDEDANALALAADWVEEDEAWEMVRTFLQTEFPAEEQHVRRLEKLSRVKP